MNRILKEVVINKIKSNTRSFRNENLYNSGRKWDANTISDKNNKRIDTLPSGHHLYKSYNTRTGQHMFHAYDPEHKRSTISVQGRLKNGVLSKPYLASHEKNTLPAHKFYAHLLNRGHLNAVSTDSQSTGAQKVWGRLSKEKGIGIHGWHKGKPVNVKYGEDETHATEKGDSSVRDMRLIAHKKLKKEETTMKTYNQFITEARYTSAQKEVENMDEEYDLDAHASKIHKRVMSPSNVDRIDTHKEVAKAYAAGRGGKPRLFSSEIEHIPGFKHVDHANNSKSPNLETIKKGLRAAHAAGKKSINEARYAMRPPGGAYSKEREREINYGVEPEETPKKKLHAIHFFKKADYSHVGKHGIERIGKDSYGIKDYGKPQNKLHIASAEKELGEKSRRWEPKS